MAPTVAPYGTWPSPISAEHLVERAVGLSDVDTHGGTNTHGGADTHGQRVVWVEGRPAEAGRYVVVEQRPDGRRVDLVPSGFSARTQAHEYGGRCWAFDGDDLICSNWEDQRLWRFPAGDGEPVPVTAPPPAPRAVRFADPVVTPDRRWLICVRERHGEDVVNDLVAVPLAGTSGNGPATAAAATATAAGGGLGDPVVLAGGHDFFAAPALSPDGSRLAWLSWDHPEMPWDATELWVADLRTDGAGAAIAGARLAAGRDGESVQQPRWSPGGVLHWVSDRTGWWNLYRDGEALAPMEAEFGVPAWVFGQRTYTFLGDGTLVAAWHGPSGSGIGAVHDGRAHPIATAYTSFRYLAAAGDAVAAVASSAREFPAVVRLGLDGSTAVLRRARDADLPDGTVSVPQRLQFPTAGGETAWALVYRPANPDVTGPEGERPPLVVMTHGGPTSQAVDDLNLAVQFWTTRGFAVADVDYRGSTGYGTAYRNRLRGSWGVCDVEDVVAAARHLAATGVVDGERCVIRGGSAGGYTTLAALAFTDAFAAGASYFGVADLGALARDTHKFESRYLDRLVGRWPQDEAAYRARSPIFHVDGFDRPLLILQGLEDMVVPPAQSEMIYEALKKKGVPVAYLAFAGEQHGFRKAETIVAAVSAEMSFYGLVLGFTPEGAVEVPVENL